MDNLVKQPVHSHARRLNSFDDSSRKLWIDSIGTENTDLRYAVIYTDKEDEFKRETPTVPVIEALISINNKLGQKEAAYGLLDLSLIHI